MSPRQIRFRRARRWATTLLSVVLAGVGLYFTLRTPERVTATANAYYRGDRRFVPDMAVDGDIRTEWLLPDQQAGWLEAQLSPPRRMTKLRILNGHNRHYNDRAVKGYKVELYDRQGNKLHAVEGEFAELSPSPEWVDHPVDLQNVARIRFEVLSSHRFGGALAEIAWEEN